MVDQFSLIKLLLSRSKKEEIKTFKAYLKAFDAGTGTYRNKSVQLLNLLLKKPIIDEVSACKALYSSDSKKNTQAFIRLLNRFKNKLFECLSMDVNLYRKFGYSETQQYRAEIYKMLVYSEISRIKGTDFDTMALYKRIILIAKKYELYSELSQVLFAYYQFQRFKASKNKLHDLYKEVIHYENCAKAYFNAGELYNKLLLETQYKASGYRNINDFEEAIRIIENDYHIYQSASILHYLLLLKMELMHKRYEYDKAELISYEQIDLYTSHPAVKMPTRLGNAFLNLGNNQLFQYKFADACKSVNKAYDYFSLNGGNYNIVKETEVYIRFYQGQLDSAIKLLKEILSLGKLSNNPSQLSKRNFLLASILVLKKKNKEAHKLLQETKEIEKDKEGFNLGLRILSIINQLEAEKLDIADLNIESMRKHIERTIKMKPVRKRDVIILKLLAKLSRHSFNFKQIWKRDQKYFELLASNEPEYRWEMKSPEMIIFHKWFQAKATGKDYDYVLKPPQPAEVN